MLGLPLPIFGKSGPTIGEVFGGGFYIGDITDSGVNYRLVISPATPGQSSSILWAYSSSVTGATSYTNGPGNTSLINTSAFPAGQFCSSRNIGGFTDWYLPAIAELSVLHANRAVLTGSDVLDANYYWSSTEVNSTTSLIRHMATGVQTTGTKTVSSIPVRAIRRVLI